MTQDLSGNPPLVRAASPVPKFLMLGGVAGACALGVAAGLWARPADTERPGFVAVSLEPEAPPPTRQLQIIVDDGPAPIGDPLEVLSQDLLRHTEPRFVLPTPAPTAQPAAGLMRVTATAPLEANALPAPPPAPVAAPAAVRPAPVKPVAVKPVAATPRKVAEAAAPKAKPKPAVVAKAAGPKPPAKLAAVKATAGKPAARAVVVKAKTRPAAAQVAKAEPKRKAAGKTGEVAKLAKAEARKAATLARAAEAKAAKALAQKARAAETRLAEARARTAAEKARKAEAAKLARAAEQRRLVANEKAAAARRAQIKQAKAQEERTRTANLQAARAKAARAQRAAGLRVASAPRCASGDPLVCGAATTADRRMTAAYRQAEAAGVPQSELRRQHERWLSARAAAAREAPWAVPDVYQERIAELRDQARYAQDGY